MDIERIEQIINDHNITFSKIDIYDDPEHERQVIHVQMEERHVDFSVLESVQETIGRPHIVLLTYPEMSGAIDCGMQMLRDRGLQLASIVNPLPELVAPEIPKVVKPKKPKKPPQEDSRWWPNKGRKT